MLLWVLSLNQCLYPYFLSRSLLNCSLKMKNYSHRFHLLLHLEEIQMEVDIRKYDLRNQTMTRDQSNSKLLRLRVRKSLLNKQCFLYFKNGVLSLLPLKACEGIKTVNVDILKQVPGVAENRPSVLRGDCLRVSKTEDTVSPITVYTGYVHRVELDSVKLGFSKK